MNKNWSLVKATVRSEPFNLSNNCLGNARNNWLLVVLTGIDDRAFFAAED
jgi:hypothetical protein